MTDFKCTICFRGFLNASNLKRHIKCPPMNCSAPSTESMIEIHQQSSIIGLVVDSVNDYKQKIADKYEEVKRTYPDDKKLACFNGLTLKELQSLLKHSEKVKRKTEKRKRELLEIVEELKSVESDIMFSSQMIEHCRNLRDIEVKRERSMMKAQKTSISTAS
jgi:hypothetical protein